MRGVDRNTERHVDEELIAVDRQVGRLLLGEPHGGVHDAGHRIERQQDGEAAAAEPHDRRAGRHRRAQLIDVRRAERIAAIVAERGRNSIERIELPEEQRGELARRLLTEIALEEAHAGAAARAGDLVGLCAHLLELTLAWWENGIAAKPAARRCEGCHAVRITFRPSAVPVGRMNSRERPVFICDAERQPRMT